MRHAHHGGEGACHPLFHWIYTAFLILAMVGARLGLWIFVLGSLYPVTALSPSPVTQPVEPRPQAALGNVEGAGVGGTRLCLPLPPGGPWAQKPLRCPFGLGCGGVALGAGWPSSAGLFLLSFIINLGHKPGQRRVPNERLFEGPRGEAFARHLFGCFFLESAPCKSGPLRRSLPLAGPASSRSQSWNSWIYCACPHLLLRELLPLSSSGPTLSTDF